MKSSREKFIKVLKGLDKDDVGPNGLWQLNYSHWNNSNFFKGFVFSYWYEADPMPDILECIEEIRDAMVEDLEAITDEQFDKGGWFASRYLNETQEVIYKFQVIGGPGSSGPPWQ